MENIVLYSSISEVVEDITHPGLKSVKFIFCDDKANANNVGIEYTDFPEVMSSAIGTPIKMKFFGNEVGGHERSIPIGFIKSMVENKLEDGTNQLIADGILFSEEYPEETDWLSEQYKQKKAPGISWELSYHQKILKDGVSWLKGIVTRAATFVKNPAYGMRTAILALASDNGVSDDELMLGLSEIINSAVWTSAYINSLPDSSFACVNKSGRHYPYKNADGKVDMPHLRAALSRIGDPANEQCGKDKLHAAAKEAGMGEAELELISPKNTVQGGNSIMEEEIKRLREQLTALEAQISEKDTEINRLTSDNEALTTSLSEKDQTISAFENKELIASRTKTLADAGITLQLSEERLVKMDDSDFTAYVEDLKNVAAEAKKGKETASVNPTLLRIPRFTTSESEEDTQPATLTEKFRSISRTRPAATE